MYPGEVVFAQLMEFLPRHEFNRCVRRYRGDYRIRGFSCRDQFLCMAFAQLTYRESLRDIEICLRAMRSKLYHAGFRGRIARSTLADANEHRDWQIYANFAQVLIGMARKLYANASSACRYLGGHGCISSGIICRPFDALLRGGCNQVFLALPFLGAKS